MNKNKLALLKEIAYAAKYKVMSSMGSADIYKTRNLMKIAEDAWVAYSKESSLQAKVKS